MKNTHCNSDDQSKDSQFRNIKKNKEKEQNHTFGKLEQAHLWHFCLINWLSTLLITFHLNN